MSLISISLTTLLHNRHGCNNKGTNRGHYLSRHPGKNERYTLHFPAPCAVVFDSVESAPLLSLATLACLKCLNREKEPDVIVIGVIVSDRE